MSNRKSLYGCADGADQSPSLPPQDGGYGWEGMHQREIMSTPKDKVDVPPKADRVRFFNVGFTRVSTTCMGIGHVAYGMSYSECVVYAQKAIIPRQDTSYKWEMQTQRFALKEFRGTKTQYCAWQRLQFPTLLACFPGENQLYS